MTKRSLRLENAILDGIAAGRPLDALCRRLRVSPSTVYHWRRQDAVFADLFAQAQEFHVDDLLVECVEIADTALSVPIKAAAGARPSVGDRIRLARSRIAVRTRVANARRNRCYAARRRSAAAAQRRAERQASAECTPESGKITPPSDFNFESPLSGNCLFLPRVRGSRFGSRLGAGTGEDLLPIEPHAPRPALVRSSTVRRPPATQNATLHYSFHPISGRILSARNGSARLTPAALRRSA